MHFLEVAFRVEKTVAAESSTERLLEELWLAQASVDLAARTEPLRGAAYRYALGLSDAATGAGMPPGEVKVRFMDASYSELWPGRPRVA